MIDVEVLRGCQVRDLRGRIGRVISVSLPWVKLAWNHPTKVATTEELLQRSDPRVWNEIDLLTLDRGWISMGSILGTRPRAKVTEFVARLRKDVLDEDDDDDVEEEVEFPSDELEVEVSYRREGENSFRRQRFESLLAASAFADALMDEGYEVRWRTEEMEEDWEVDLTGMWECLAESCKACDAEFLEWVQGHVKALEEGGRRRDRSGATHGGFNPFKRKKVLGPGPRGGKRRAQTGEWICGKGGKKDGKKYVQKCYNKKTKYYKTIVIDAAWKAQYNKDYRNHVKDKREKKKAAARQGWANRRARARG